MAHVLLRLWLAVVQDPVKPAVPLSGDEVPSQVAFAVGQVPRLLSQTGKFVRFKNFVQCTFFLRVCLCAK